jgi:ribosomal protein L14
VGVKVLHSLQGLHEALHGTVCKRKTTTDRTNESAEFPSSSTQQFGELHMIHISNVCYAVAGSAITGPVAKECADLWPRIASAANSIV